MRIATVDSETPSPFASSLLFSYVASFIYDGDAPLAERRAQALAVDQSQLRELLGDAELRELLDADSMDAIERQLQRLDPQYRVKSADGVHDMLLSLGDLTEAEVRERSLTAEVAASTAALLAARRVLAVRVAGEPRVIAVEDAARFRDALGVPMPVGIPESLLQPVRDPLGDLALRYARTHAPFPAAEFALRYGLGVAGRRSGADAPGRGRTPGRRASSAPAARGASGRTPVCFACCAAARSPSCATKSNRSIRRSSAGSRPRGRGS